MIPFARVLKYGNTAIKLPKVSYDFTSGVAVNNGQMHGTFSGGTYFQVPNSGGQYGVYGATSYLTLDTTISITTRDYSLECMYYLNNPTPGYATACGFGNLGIRYGDGGFGNRLQAGSSLAQLTTCYTTAYTRASTNATIMKFKLERINNITRLYVNDALTNFSIGTSTSYTNTSIVDNISVVDYNRFNIGGPSLALMSFTFDF